MLRQIIAQTILLSLAIAAPALAQALPTSWSVAAEGRWCHASNRDATEFGVAAYNGLWFFQSGGSDRIMMRVYFWPGAFGDDETVTLTVQMKDSTLELALAGKTTGDSIVDLDEPLSQQDIDGMETAGLVTLSASGVEPKLAFRTDGLSVAIASLSACAQKLGKG